MKKRFTIVLLLLVAAVVQGKAQNIRVPAWEKFVQINKAGVNLRKSPNVQSARLMAKTEEVDFQNVTTLSWTAGAGKRPFCLEENAVVPVIEETDDWYRIYIYDYNTYSSIQDAYIRRDFCTTTEPDMLATANENSQEGWTEEGQAYKLTGSNDLYVAYDENEMDGYDACVGKAFGVGVVWLRYDGFFNFLRTISGNSYGSLNMDMSKITEARISQFMRSHQYQTPGSISYRFGLRNFTYRFNPTEYPFRMTSQPETYNVQKFVVSANGQELQIRQKPNTTAPKLVFVKGDASPYFWGSLEWECKYGFANREPAMSVAARIFAVVGEEGEWYKVLGCYNYWLGGIYSAVGYVAKNDVTDAIVEPMTEAILLGDSYTANGKNKDGRGRIFSFPDSDDAVVTWGYPRVGSGAVEPAVIGHIRNGIAFMYGDDISYFFDDRERKAVIGNSTFPGTRLGKVSDGGYWEVDFTKLTTDDVRKLLRDNRGESYSYAYVNINNQALHILSLGTVNARQIVFRAAQ